MPSETSKASPPKVIQHGSDSPTHSKTPSISSSTATSTTKRMDSLVDDEIIQQNLKELMEKKNREERKANGRMVAVIIASLVIFCAVYQAWIKKSAHLAGVLVPALIMFSFAGWVVILAKRDKARRALFKCHSVHKTNSYLVKDFILSYTAAINKTASVLAEKYSDGQRTLVEAVINATPPVPQPATHIGDAVVMVPAATAASPATISLESKRKQQLQRVKALKEPSMVRMGSAP
ncbi:uncharacterized protein LOC133333680 [Musca vetustissima]|uniref:uncharacterized protein LOC133333680 n=1 Tax=Musca vetustissima TaxID=27455 RepID=UPI002AB713D3|nr:uncharacterized protein LOC133333680 [Musca vetustissima]